MDFAGLMGTGKIDRSCTLIVVTNNAGVFDICGIDGSFL